MSINSLSEFPLVQGFIKGNEAQMVHSRWRFLVPLLLALCAAAAVVAANTEAAKTEGSKDSIHFGVGMGILFGVASIAAFFAVWYFRHKSIERHRTLIDQELTLADVEQMILNLQGQEPDLVVRLQELHLIDNKVQLMSLAEAFSDELVEFGDITIQSLEAEIRALENISEVPIQLVRCRLMVRKNRLETVHRSLTRVQAALASNPNVATTLTILKECY